MRLTGPIIFKSWLYSIETGILAPSQLESTIVLLPKVGKDCKNIKNWRPITLSNCDLKIVTKALSQKMSKVLDQIIVQSQVAYIPGRSVMDNLRSNFFFKQHCRANKINSVLISLDAKKAFDSVDHKYIEETLQAYGFGPKLISTFKVLYNKITARILVNGFQSEAIKIERGVKQGDALSCAIFIICIDPLIRNINSNKRIIPVIIRKKNNREKVDINFKAAAYADDISVVCNNSQDSIQQVFNEYSRLTKWSGLELNADKTEILRLDDKEHVKIDITYEGETHKIKSISKIKICGLFYCNNKDDEYQLNVLDKIKKLAAQIKKWSHNNLTMEGKNLIIKTIGLSQLIYNMQAYQLEEKEIVQIERIIFGFLWSTSKNEKGIDRISRSVMKNEYLKGGLMVTDVECLDRALKTRQFIRASRSNHPISNLQAYLTNQNEKDFNLKFEYCNINHEENICSRAQSTLNIITDFYRSHLSLEGKNVEEINNIVNDVSSINVRSFLKRKNKLFHVCVMKPLNDLSIEMLGELTQEYEYNSESGLSERMKIVLGAIPANLKNILEYINENTSCNKSLSSFTLKNKSRKDIYMITTKEFQSILKSALNKIGETNFMLKLGISSKFEQSNIAETRKMCKNTKLQSIFFRLIHNDFFTRVRMKKLKMVDSELCLRCGSPETMKHLLWECFQAYKVWDVFNNMLIYLGLSRDCVNSYDKIYNHAGSSAITTIKLKLIQVLIQIDRPTNWNKDNVINAALEIIKIEKYNAKINNHLTKFKAKWNEIENNIYKYKLSAS